MVTGFWEVRGMPSALRIGLTSTRPLSGGWSDRRMEPSLPTCSSMRRLCCSSVSVDLWIDLMQAEVASSANRRQESSARRQELKSQGLLRNVAVSDFVARQSSETEQGACTEYRRVVEARNNKKGIKLNYGC